MTTISKTDLTENKTVTKKDLNKVFLRSFTLEASFNFERMQALGYVFSMIPVIKKLYTTKEDISAALKRHLEFFNTTPHVSTFAMGISSALEEKNANDQNFDEASINSIKLGLMGPLGGVGDAFFWGTLKAIAAGVGASIALQGNILGAILFYLIFNIPHVLVRYYGTMSGYRLGTTFVERLQESGLLDNITYGASILGMTVIGAMTATMVTFTTPLQIGEGDGAVTIQSMLDSIAPSLLPLLFTLFMYYLLKKGVKITYLLVGIVAFGIIGKLIGIV